MKITRASHLFLALFLLVLALVVIVACLILIAALVYGGIIVITPLVALLVGVEESTARIVAIVLVAAVAIVGVAIGFARFLGIKGV